MKKFITLTHLIVLAGLAAFAQDAKKLKEIQAANLWTPSPVKVDGKLAEWDDSFQAYNKATKLFYTISNDEKNIYLAIKSTDATNNNKITAGGITLTVNTEGKKKDKDAMILTFPVVQPFNRGQRPGGGAPGAPGAGGAGSRMTFMGGGAMGGGRPGAFTMDSTMIKAAHERTITAAKEIKIFGFKDVTDTLISIYNEYGIKAAIGYNEKNDFTYEMAIPIKLLGLKKDGQEFAYQVKVNGLVIPPAMQEMMANFGGGGAPGGGFGGGGAPGGGFGGGGAPGGGVRTVVVNGAPGGGAPRGMDMMGTLQEMTSPSDFWGKYILAKK